ncbi:MAG: FeoB-associated Cys-rich membrane protein [Clostridia bacterium]|nr:FeoB-associated Cys-rich membrane protein [Clostridia bacterium]
MTWQTIVVAAIVAAVFAAIIVKGLINKKNGKSSCSCSSCGGCANKEHCHSNK